MSSLLKRTFAILAILTLVITGSPLISTIHAASFRDLPSKHWANDSIQWGLERAIVSGYPDGTFRQDEPVRQAEFLAMLVLLNSPDQPRKAQTWEQPFYDYAAKMSWNLSGNRFIILKRGQAAQMLAQAAGYSMSENESIQFMLDSQIVKGKTQPTLAGFAAAGSLTRAEAVQMLRTFSTVYTEARKAEPTIYLDYSRAEDDYTLHSPKDSFRLLTKRYVGESLRLRLNSDALMIENSIDLAKALSEQVISLPNGFSEGYVDIQLNQDKSNTTITKFNFSAKTTKNPTITGGPIQTPRYQLSSLFIADSRLNVTCSTVADYPITVASVVFTKDDVHESYENFCSENGVIYLRHGAGEYRILLGYSDENGNYLEDGVFYITNIDLVDHTFLFPEHGVQSEHPEIIQLAESITNGLISDYDKTKAIHDWVTRNIAYDAKNYYADTISDVDNFSLNVIHSRVAICTGYAYLTAALNRAVGIRTQIIEGIAGTDEIKAAMNDDPTDMAAAANHAWNEVWIDGKWII
ncbi:MAG: S-layer homology domain-containing protein, partial [Gorillibacterium sp.]|nr:S-layer homology domain-containing protein [Gorillibacterium sp.]